MTEQEPEPEILTIRSRSQSQSRNGSATQVTSYTIIESIKTGLRHAKLIVVRDDLLSHIERFARAGAGICVRLEPEPEIWRGRSQDFRRARAGNCNKAETEPEPDRKRTGSATQITTVTDIWFNEVGSEYMKVIQYEMMSCRVFRIV
jgi:hypothetical protein